MNRYGHRGLRAIIILAAAGALSACGGTHTSATPVPAGAPTGRGSDTSWVTSYNSLGDVGRDSSVIVQGEVIPGRRQVPAAESTTSGLSAGLLASVSPFRVTRSLKGTIRPGQVILVRQIGDQ